MKINPPKISGIHDGATPNVFRNAKKLRDLMTQSENKLWDYLKTKPKGYTFRRQHPIAGCVLDFYCHKLRLSIEIDGGYHLKKEQMFRDKVRTEYLNSLEITEIRFTNKQISESFKTVIKSIKSYLSVDIPLGHRRSIALATERNEGERKGKIDTNA